MLFRDIKELFFESEVPDYIYFSSPKFKKLSKNRDFGNILAPGCVLVDHLLSQKLVDCFKVNNCFLESVWALLSDNTFYCVGWAYRRRILAYLCVGGPGWGRFCLCVYGPLRSGPFEIPKERNISGFLVNIDQMA